MKRILLTMLLMKGLECGAFGELFGYNEPEKTFCGFTQSEEDLLFLSVIKCLVISVPVENTAPLITSSISRGLGIDKQQQQSQGTAAVSASAGSGKEKEQQEARARVVIIANATEKPTIAVAARSVEIEKLIEQEAKLRADLIEEEKNADIKYEIEYIEPAFWKEGKEIHKDYVLGCCTIKTNRNFIRLVCVVEGELNQAAKNTIYFVINPSDLLGSIQRRWIKSLLQRLPHIPKFADELRLRPMNFSVLRGMIHLMPAKLDRWPLTRGKWWLEMGQLVTESREWDAVMFSMKDGSVNLTCKTAGYNAMRSLNVLGIRILNILQSLDYANSGHTPLPPPPSCPPSAPV